MINLERTCSSRTGKYGQATIREHHGARLQSLRILGICRLCRMKNVHWLSVATVISAMSERRFLVPGAVRGWHYVHRS